MSDKKLKYVPLHVHTEYSVGDGSGRIYDNLKYAKSVGFDSCAITDHGTIGGHWSHAKYCKELGLKPIFGNEFYVTDDYNTKTDKRYHIVLLAKDNEGLSNIYKLNTIAHQNFYYKPRITLQDIIKYKKGIIVTSACTIGIISQRIVDGDLNGAKKVLSLLKKEFEEDFYLEVQPHYFDHQLTINPVLVKWAKDYGVKTTIATDVHYPNKDLKIVHNALKAISFNKSYGEASFTGNTHCFLTPQELLEDAQKVNLTKEQVLEAMKNTLEISGKCNASIKPSGGILPKFEEEEE